MTGSTLHVVGAGVAGLAAALRLAEIGRAVVIHEAAGAAGGRCRSYDDPAIGMRIDNGNHLLLSGNHAALDYLDRIGARDTLTGPASAEFDFADLRSGERWRLRPNDGRLPWWLLDRGRRTPGASLRDHFAPLGLLRAKPDATIGEAMTCAGPLYERLWRPVLLAGLNTEPPEASATLAATILRETLGAGGRACRPLIASQGLSHSFVEPALAALAGFGSAVRFGARLRAIDFGGDRVRALRFDDGTIALGPSDAVALAVPAWSARDLAPGLDAPDEYRAIVNAHFRVAPPTGQPAILGVVNGLIEWLFAYPGHLSVTISGADRLIGRPREDLAAEIWSEVAALSGLGPDLPPWQVVKERRATFAATPAQDAKRPPARTRWSNLALAGDWTQTGLPATLEGAIRSGYKAASILDARVERASRLTMRAAS